MAKALTAIAIEELKKRPGASRREIPDGKVAGLYFVLQPSGASSWALRYRLHGKPYKLTIGPGILPLDKARKAANEHLVKIAEGENPAATKAAEKLSARTATERTPADLVEKVASSFLERYAKRQCKETTWKEYERILENNIVTVWKGRRLGELTRADVHELLDGMIDRGAAVQANRTFATLRKMSNWALERGVIDRNPCAGLKAPTPETSRERVLSDDEIRLAWKAFERVGWPFGRLGQLLLLTGARRDEIAEAQWIELDAAKKLLILPPSRMKANAAHEIPLSDAAMKIIADLPKIAPKNKGPMIAAKAEEPKFMFTTSGERPASGFSKGKAIIDRVIAEIVHSELGEEAKAPPHWVFHDLRRTVATNLQRLGIRLEVTEAVLGHVSGSRAGIVGIYQRHNFAEEKRAALTAWANRLDAIVNGTPGHNVVAISNKKATKK